MSELPEQTIDWRDAAGNLLAASIRALQGTSPFFAHFFLQMDRVFDRDGIKTLAVSVNRSGMVLYVNSRFFVEVLNTPEARGEVLKHEMLHLLFKHCQRGPKFADQGRVRIAAELAVNSYLDRSKLPKKIQGVFPIDFRFENELSLNEYYDLLEGIDQAYELLDEHDTWSEDGNIPDSVCDQIIVGAASRAKSASSIGFGKLPKGVQEQIESLLMPPLLSWELILRRFFTSCASGTRVLTRRRPSRRFRARKYGAPAPPGHRTLPHFRIVCAMDVSGSVSDEDFNNFYNEIRGIEKNGAVVTFIQWDVDVYVLGKLTKNKMHQRKGAGGTDPSAAIAWINERKKDFDGAVFLTDGYIGNLPERLLVKTLFVICNNGSIIPGYPCVKIPESKTKSS